MRKKYEKEYNMITEYLAVKLGAVNEKDDHTWGQHRRVRKVKVPFLKPGQRVHAVQTVQEAEFFAMLTEYTECWPCLIFDILLNKYFPAG